MPTTAASQPCHTMQAHRSKPPTHLCVTDNIVMAGWPISQAWPALTRAWVWWLYGGLMVYIAGMASSYGGVSWVVLWWFDGLYRRHGQFLRRACGGVSYGVWVVVAGWPVLWAQPAVVEG